MVGKFQRIITKVPALCRTGRALCRAACLALCLTLCLSAVYSVPVWAAQNPSFRLDMNSLKLQEKVSTTLILSLINAQGAELVSFEGLEHFDVLSQSRSTSSSTVNGETTYQEDIYISLMPKSTGSFTLKATLRYDGQEYETNTLAVTVGRASDPATEEAQDLFITTEVSHEEAYLGEKIVVTYTLYTRYSIDTYGFTDYVAIDGVMTQEIPDSELNAEYVYVNDTRYAKYEARQLIIDPLKTGDYVIPSYNFQVNVISDSGMGGFGGLFRTTTPVYLQTDTKEFTVKPLPSAGRPASFSGIVGALQVSGQYSREEMNYGDSFALYATASGRCNLDGLKNITGGSIPGFSTYETAKNAAAYVEDGRYHGQKDFEIIFVPEQTGALEVPPIAISYFNPATEKYETAEIPGTTVTVSGEMPPVNSAPSVGSLETVFINQVNYADTRDGYFSLQIKKSWVYGGLAALALAFALAVLIGAWAARQRKQDATLKALYKQMMHAKDCAAVYQLFNALIKYRYQISLKATAQSEIEQRLPDAELAAKVIDIMHYMESGKAQDAPALAELKGKAKSIYQLFLRKPAPKQPA